MYRGTQRKLAVALLIFAIIFTVAFYLTQNYPTDVAYNRKFGTYVTIATQSASLNRTWNAILIFGNNMHEVFPITKYDYNTTYNCIALGPLNGGYIWENSLAAEEDYLIGLNETMPTRIDAVNRNLVGATEQGALYDLRNEMNSYGGLDWAVKGAYYTQFAPLVYWSGWIGGIGWTVTIIAIVILWFTGDEYSRREREEREERYSSRRY